MSYAIYDGSNLGSRNLVRDKMTEAEVDEFFCDLADATAMNYETF